MAVHFLQFISFFNNTLSLFVCLCTCLSLPFSLFMLLFLSISPLSHSFFPSLLPFHPSFCSSLSSRSSSLPSLLFLRSIFPSLLPFHPFFPSFSYYSPISLFFHLTNSSFPLLISLCIPSRDGKDGAHDLASIPYIDWFPTFRGKMNTICRHKRVRWHQEARGTRRIAWWGACSL